MRRLIILALNLALSGIGFVKEKISLLTKWENNGSSNVLNLMNGFRVEKALMPN